MTIALTGNRRLIYDALCRCGDGCISFGTLALLCGCHKNTVKNAVHEMAARGLLRYESNRGKPNRYELS